MGDIFGLIAGFIAGFAAGLIFSSVSITRAKGERAETLHRCVGTNAGRPWWGR